MWKKQLLKIGYISQTKNKSDKVLTVCIEDPHEDKKYYAFVSIGELEQVKNGSLSHTYILMGDDQV